VEKYFEIPTGPIEQVGVSPLVGRDKLPVDSQGMSDEILQLQIRCSDATVTLPASGQRVAFERWRGVTGLGKSRGRRILRLYVGVTDWPQAITHEQRTRAVTGAFVAGLSMFQQLTGIALPGTERL
jgi:hypothetical protein